MWDVTASVILPCYNRARLLPLTLEGFRNQTIDANSFEVIIVDDGSQDDTSSVVNRHLWEGIRYYWKPNGGISSARNYGARYATKQILIFSDPDIVPCPDFLQNHLSRHTTCSKAIVLGRKKSIISHLPAWVPSWPTMPVLKRVANRPDRFHKLISKLFSFRLRPLLTSESQHTVDTYEKLSLPFYLPDPPSNVESLSIPWVFTIGCNVSLPADLFQHVGGFDENFTGWGLEDIEFGYRLFKAGGRFTYADDATGYHQTHYVDILKNQENTQENLRYFLQKHPAFEVKLHADYIDGRITLEQYDALVRKHYTEADFQE